MDQLTPERITELPGLVLLEPAAGAALADAHPSHAARSRRLVRG